MRRHFLVLFLPLACLVIVALVLMGRSQSRGELRQLGTEESMRVRLGTAEFVRSLKKAPQQLRSLTHEKAIRAAIDEPGPETEASMEDAFTTLLDRNPEYYRVRWIDETGRERVRVDRDESGVVIVPDAELRDLPDQDYVKDTAQRGIGEIYISPLDLRRDGAMVSVSDKPTLRFATAVADKEGTRRGVLVINYLAGPLLADFVDVTGEGDRHVMLLNRQGYFLSSPDPADEWGFVFGRPITLGGRFPAVWARINQAASGQFRDASGLWTWQVAGIQTGNIEPLSKSAEPTWLVVAHLPDGVIGAAYARVWRPLALIGAVLLAVFAALSWHIAVRSRREQQALEARVKAEAVTEQSRPRLAALEAAHEAGSRLAAIIESTQDAIVGKTLDGTITSWNPAAEKLYGYSAEEAIGRGVQMLMAPGEEHEEQRILERIGRGETIGHFETLRQHKNGHLINVSVTISPIRDASGRVVGASKIARDITSEKRAEAELKEHREHLEELVERRTAQIAETTERLRAREKFITTVTDNLPGMVGYWDHDLRCRFANRAYFEWFGRTPEQMIGKTMQEICDEGSFRPIGRPAIAAVLKGEPQQFHDEIRKPSGEIGHVSAHFIPDRVGDEVVGFFVLVTDITLLKRAEGELRRANEQLADAVAIAERANLAKGQFLANMSHEIRTPMNGVIGMLEVLGHTALDGEQVRMIGTISGSARSLLQIINDILDFSKIEAGQLRIEAIAADPTEIVESTVRLFLGAAAAKGLVLRCFVSPAIRGRFLTDPVRLRQIIGNLISNAIKFTARGVVTITVDVVAGDEGRQDLRFAVADTGIGIPRDVLPLLFQPFTQADDSTARRFGGTGLGLSICRRLVDLMGGTIGLDSVEGDGTRVTVTLPRHPVETKPEDRTLDLNGVRVALVTADAVEQHYLAAYLTHWGAMVTVILPDAAPPSDPFTLILAPLALMASIEPAGWIPVGPPRRFVYYSYADEPVDRNPTNEAILTTALSRARIITAVAVAAGRTSPEVEMVHVLPRYPSRGRAPSRDQAIAEGRLILLAEDHPVNQEVILRQLRLLGYAADAVGDGVAALAALARTRYALLLTDCSMPGMDGFELTRRIRLAEPEGSHLPIIALTANALDGEDTKCRAAGMDDYLAKPAEMAVLREMLKRWLPGEAATQLAPPPALDLAVLAQSCGDDPAVLSETLASFIEILKLDIERLCASVAQNNADETQLFAHRIKGAARIVGGQYLAACSEAVERSAEACDWPAIDHDMKCLLEATRQIEQAHAELTVCGPACSTVPDPRCA